MRTQYCREHIDAVAENCGLEQKTVDEVKRVATFCEEHSDMSDLATRAIMPLIREKDENIRGLAIIKCSERLNGKIGAGRGNTKGLTEKDVRLIIDRVRSEIKKEAEPHPIGVQPEEPIQTPAPQNNGINSHQAPEPAPVSEPAKVPQIIKDKRAKTEQLIEEMLSNMSLRFDGIIERFMTDFPQRFPTKESVIAEALDSLSENFKP